MSRLRNMDERLSAWLDGELTLAEAKALERRLAEEPAFAQRLEALKHQRELLRASVPDPDPAHLARLLDRAEARADAARGRLRRLLGTVAISGVAAAAGYAVAMIQLRSEIRQTDIAALVEDALSAHAIFSVEVVHPVEVPATQRDHLETWLSNRLGGPVEAPEIGSLGFHLIGGRLLPAGTRPAAQFMFENADGERLTFFAVHAAANGQDAAPSFADRNGVGGVFWQDGPWLKGFVGPFDRTTLGRLAAAAGAGLT